MIRALIEMAATWVILKCEEKLVEATKERKEISDQTAEECKRVVQLHQNTN